MLTLGQTNKTWTESKLYFKCICGKVDHISNLLNISLSPDLLCPSCKQKISRSKLLTKEENPEILQIIENESSKKQVNKKTKKQLNFNWIKETLKKI